MTELVDKKVEEALKLTQDKVDKTYLSVMDGKSPKSSVKVQPLKRQNNRLEFNHNVSQSLRMQNVTEDPNKTKAEN